MEQEVSNKSERQVAGLFDRQVVMALNNENDRWWQKPEVHPEVIGKN
jgi:hypothetical protein